MNCPNCSEYQNVRIVLEEEIFSDILSDSRSIESSLSVDTWEYWYHYVDWKKHYQNNIGSAFASQVKEHLRCEKGYCYSPNHWVK